jgi:hypothetical protein
MPFATGNKSAANRTQKSWRDVVAQMIRKRLEQEGDKLTNAQFISLVNRLSLLKARKGPHKDRKKKRPENSVDAMVLALEAQRKDEMAMAICETKQN